MNAVRSIVAGVLCLVGTASFGKNIHVALGGSDEAAGTEAAPYASIEKAVTSAGAGDIVIVGEGTFALPTEITLENTTGWKLKGAGIGKTILTGGNRHTVCFSVNHADAEFSGFTLNSLKWNSDDRRDTSACFNLVSGYLHDLSLANVDCSATGKMSGLGVRMTGGRIADIVFDKCFSSRSDMPTYGSAVRQTGGISERLTICNCYGNAYGGLYLSGGSNICSKIFRNASYYGSSTGGGVTMEGGTLIHATIWGNSAGANGSKFSGGLGGGLYHTAGVVTNCIVWGNVVTPITSASNSDWYTKKNAAQAESLVFGLCSSAALGSGAIVGDPQFVDPENGDFSLKASSLCILPDGTTLGAVAYDHAKADAAMTVSTCAAFETEDISFVATVRNLENPTYSWTVTDTTSGEEVNTSADANFAGKFAAGTYDVKLEVFDNGSPVATDERIACFRTHALTNYFESSENAAEMTVALTDALSNSIDGETFVFGEGEWTFPADQIVIDKAIKIVGAGVDRTFFVGGSRHNRMLLVKNPGAELSGFTVKGVSWNRDDSTYDRTYEGLIVRLVNGFVHDVAFAAISHSKKTYWNKGMVYMSGGRMVDVTISGMTCAQGDCYAPMYQTGGLSERCSYFDNTCTKNGGGLYLTGGSNCYAKIYRNVAAGSSATGGGVCMTGGTLLHATIWGNGAGTDKTSNTGARGGGLYHAGGVVTNCIAFGNSAPSQAQTDAGKPDWYSSRGAADQAKLVFNLCSSVALGTNPIVGDPQLTDPDNGDFSPTASSPCVFPTFTVGAVEYDRSQADASMSVAPVRVFDTDYVCFTSTVMNVSNPVYAWTVTDAGGTVVKESSDSWFDATFEKGVYDVKLVVKDGENLVKTDERLALVHVYTVTNVIEAGVADALTDAVDDSLDGQIFLLQPGIHEVTRTVTVNDDLKIIGPGHADCIVKKKGATDRAFFLNNEHALLTGVTVTGGRFNDDQRNSWGAGVLVGDNGGTVSYCVITNNGTASGHFMRGGGVGITGPKGLVTHCLIAHNTTKWLQSDFGGGAAISAGRLENCLIRDNEALMGGGVAVSGSGKVRNCTIVNNTAGTAGGGLCWWNASNGSAEVRNCVYSGNVADTDTSAVKPNVGYIDGANGRQAYLSCSNSVFSCAYEGSAVLGIGSVALKDPFENAAADNWHFKLGVAGVDAGTAYANGDAFAETDFDGCARIIGDAIDIGAFETDTGVFGASMNLDRTEALENDPFGVSATVTGSDDYDCSWTVYGPNGAVVANYTTVAWTNGFAAVGRYDIEMTVTDRDDPTKTVTDRRNGIFYVGPRAIDLVSGDDIIAAVEASLDGTKITLGPGEYVITNKFKIQKGIVIEGPGYKLCTVRPVDTIIGDRRVFHLNHADVVLRGITVTGGRLGTSPNGIGDTRGLTGGGVYIDTAGGLVENCRLTDNRAGTYNSSGGGVGVNSAKGVVRNCLIDHNSVYWQGVSDETGGGVYLTAGVISNCVICANRATCGGGVYVASAATIASCTIASNTANTAGGIYFDAWGMSSRFRDSIVWGNVDRQGSPRDGTTYAPEYGVGATITTHDLINYCAFSEGTKLPTDDARHLMGVGNFTCDPGFKRFDKLDFRIKMFSPCDRVSSTGSWLGALEPYPAGLLLLVK